jgi:hypothetical protein
MIKPIKLNIDFYRKELSLRLDKFYIQWFSGLFDIQNCITESLRKMYKCVYSEKI